MKSIRENTVVLHCADLTEESGDEGFPDIYVVVSASELSASAAQGKAVHDARELLPYTVGQLQ